MIEIYEAEGQLNSSFEKSLDFIRMAMLVLYALYRMR